MKSVRIWAENLIIQAQDSDYKLTHIIGDMELLIFYTNTYNNGANTTKLWILWHKLNNYVDAFNLKIKNYGLVKHTS